MLSKDQEQKVESNSTAIQAGRDVNYHGLSVAEVKELCVLFLRNNFPELQAEARRIAEEQVRVFASSLENRLALDAASIVIDKFREPDVQAAINDAVQACARKGAAANPDILSALISERVAINTNSFKDIVVSEAVQVVPRLTSSQIALISFVHFVRSIRLQSLSDVSALEPFGQAALAFSNAGFGLSDAQKQHLQYAGAASVLNIVSGDIYQALNQEYAYFGFSDTEVFKQQIKSKAPSFAKILDQFTAENLFTVTLTSVGQAIALANISKYLGNLDYCIWLK